MPKQPLRFREPWSSKLNLHLKPFVQLTVKPFR